MNLAGPDDPSIAGPDFEGTHVKPIRVLLEDALDAAGFRVVQIDGNVLLRAPDADEYEVRVQRADDPHPHYLTLRLAAPATIDGIWRVVRRAERWLRPPKRRLYVT